MAINKNYRNKPNYYSKGYGAGYGYLAYDCARKAQGNFEQAALDYAFSIRIPESGKPDFVRGFVNYCETH